ncbi:MAG: hypothetical protein PWQ25_1631 [Deferribacteres bacterium]|jgi:hypothetical protein|nr:hypothetical protein [Deferribacteres bacterium]
MLERYLISVAMVVLATFIAWYGGSVPGVVVSAWCFALGS